MAGNRRDGVLKSRLKLIEYNILILHSGYSTSVLPAARKGGRTMELLKTPCLTYAFSWRSLGSSSSWP